METGWKVNCTNFDKKNTKFDNKTKQSSNDKIKQALNVIYR